MYIKNKIWKTEMKSLSYYAATRSHDLYQDETKQWTTFKTMPSLYKMREKFLKANNFTELSTYKINILILLSYRNKTVGYIAKNRTTSINYA